MEAAFLGVNIIQSIYMSVAYKGRSESSQGIEIKLQHFL